MDRARKSRNRWLYISIISWAVALCVIAIFGVYVVIRGQQVNTQLCKVANDNRTILVNMLTVAKKQALESAFTLDEENQIRQRYNELRALIPPLECTSQGGPQELEP